MAPKRASAVERITRDLEAAIRAGALSAPSSIGVLAREYNVSYPTMHRAMRLLREKGLVFFKQGEPLTFAGTGSGKRESSRAAHALFSKIYEGISEGTYRAGNALPKIDYFVLTHRVARRTVVEALRMVARKGLAHRQGKHLIVGTPSRDRIDPRYVRLPTVLLVTTSYDQLYLNYTAHHPGSFMQSVHDELEKFGYRVKPLFTSKNSQLPPPDESGDIFQREVNDLGKNYSGCLIMCGTQRNEYLGEWIRAIASRKRPVVFFDSTGIRTDLSNRIAGSGAKFIRCYFDEWAAIRIAVDALSDAGHRRIGIPTPNAQTGWIVRRNQRLREIYTHKNADITLIQVPMDVLVWNPRPWISSSGNFRMPEISETEHRTSSPGFQQSAHKNVNAVTAAMKECGITALIAPNDHYARQYYLGLTERGISVPDRLSLISFDNMPASRLLPISSIEFGFGTLGYQAAHLFIDDIRIVPDREGHLAGKCRIVDRGSIANMSTSIRLRSFHDRE